MFKRRQRNTISAHHVIVTARSYETASGAQDVIVDISASDGTPAAASEGVKVMFNDNVIYDTTGPSSFIPWHHR